MKITIENLKAVIAKLKYQWFTDRPNIIGIRTKENISDVFNDYLAVVYMDGGNELLRVYSITTEPGVYYQKKLLNANGCAVMIPGQYINCYSLGFHQNKPTHRALIETGKINVLRDKDMDGIAGNSGTKDSGYFGCNIHGSQMVGTTQKVGPWSAGCQVFDLWGSKEELMDICEKFKEVTGNKFTYTLVQETDF